MKKYVCTICGYIYDEAAGIPDVGIAPGTVWESLPADWACPLCRASKSEFRVESASVKENPVSPKREVPAKKEVPEEMGSLSFGELSALCSNLAKGCEKQYLPKEMDLFVRLADYFKTKSDTALSPDLEAISSAVKQDLDSAYPSANNAAEMEKDRGAKRALVWSEKVTRILNSILERYEKEGDTFLEKTNIYVCDICGFIYVGDEPPAVCPVCKVPAFKIAKVQRG